MKGFVLLILLSSDIFAWKLPTIRGKEAKDRDSSGLRKVDAISFTEALILEDDKQTMKTDLDGSNRHLQEISNGTVFQTYFIPLPEPLLFSETFEVINDVADGYIQNTFSIAVGIDNTQIFYDHWEDGYDDTPGEGGTTLIFGDGDLSNGNLTADDILKGGKVYLLENAIPQGYSANPSTPYLFDGMDRIQTNNPIAVTRASYPENPGSLMAGACEIFHTGQWGNTYEVPIGQNDGASNTKGHETVVAYIQASESDTGVFIDGVFEGSLDIGESLTASGVSVGQSISATKPVQVEILSGDRDSEYELRWFALIPKDAWGTAYISPVAQYKGGSVVGGTSFGFYNPNNNPITVTYVGLSFTQSSFTIPAGATTKKEVRPPSTTGTDILNFNYDSGDEGPYYSGIKFEANDPFYCYAEIDGESGGNGEIFDWGFPLMPLYKTSTQVLVGDGRACTNTASCTESKSPIWVTCEEDCDLKLYLNGIDNAPFAEINDVSALASVRFYDDSSPYDYSGAIITATKPKSDEGVRIVAAWGQDPDRSGLSDGNALDLGTLIVPLPGPLQTISNGSIRGTVTDQTTGNKLAGVLITLLDNDGTVLQTATTDNVGIYQFSDLEPGSYSVVETNLIGYGDISDQDETFDGDIYDNDTMIDNIIRVTLQAGEIDDENNFVDFLTPPTVAPSSTPSSEPSKVASALPSFEPSVSPSNQPSEIPRGEIIGNVKDSNGAKLAGITITLKDENGNSILSTLTNNDGVYSFTNLLPKNYAVIQTNFEGYNDVSDQDEEPDGDVFDNDETVDSAINVMLIAGESDTGNNFVDIRLGAVTGSVTDTDGNNLTGVIISLKDELNNVVASTQTDSSGYSFTNVVPGNYIIEEQNLPGYMNIKDEDELDDGDMYDSDTNVDNRINVTINAGEIDAGNNFVDVQLGNITGSVRDTTGGSLFDILIILEDENGNTILTTLTDGTGFYSFTNLLPGNYVVLEQNLIGFDNFSDQDELPDGDIFDVDTTVDNAINVALNAGETDAGNNFVNVELGIITGSVRGSDGDSLNGVTIVLKDDDGNTVLTTTTDSTGSYSFANIVPGIYSIVQTNLVGYQDISDQDEEPDGDVFDNDMTIDNIINVTLNPGELDAGNNFVDNGLGNITGTVQDIDGKNLTSVTIILKDKNNNTILSTLTDSTGSYSFTNLAPDNYTVLQTNLEGYNDVSDQDEEPDGDVFDNDTTVDSTISVTLNDGETDAQNNFVDLFVSPSSLPSSSPSLILTAAPSFSPSQKPSIAQSNFPSNVPTREQSTSPSGPFPSSSPFTPPSLMPSHFPSGYPSLFPTFYPSNTPSLSGVPSRMPSFRPSKSPNACNGYQGKSTGSGRNRSRKLQFHSNGNTGSTGSLALNSRFRNSGFGGNRFGRNSSGNSNGRFDGGSGSRFSSGSTVGPPSGTGSLEGGGYWKGSSNLDISAGGEAGGGGGGSASVNSSGNGSGYARGNGQGGGSAAGCVESNTNDSGYGSGTGNNLGGGGFSGGAFDWQSNGESTGGGGGFGDATSQTTGNAGGSASGSGNGYGKSQGIVNGNSSRFGFGNGSYRGFGGF